jgi:GH15 family glucan-1,4-alpha-glucosidase
MSADRAALDESEIGAHYPPISDYAIIGDCRSAALVSRDGSIDWLCFPRFDSPSIFASILDTARGGRFRIRPTAPFSVERWYAPGSNVLETVFTTATGRVLLRDLMPVWSEEEKRTRLLPDHELLREVEGLEGEVEVEAYYAPRPDYGRLQPRLAHRGRLGLYIQNWGPALVLRSDVDLQVTEDGLSALGRATVRPGTRHYFSLTYTKNDPAVFPELGEAARARVEHSIRWWQEWAGRCTYQGPYRSMVSRSALTLKLLAYAPSGAITAAPTTSLPEEIGGVRNWDYRFCWLRDASFTMRALLTLGFLEEGDAFLDWLMHATRLSAPEIQVMYDVFGESRLTERELDHLEGYRHSRPVRVGNAAHRQLQLDVYGELVDAAAEFVAHGGTLESDAARFLTGVGHAVIRLWREPDEGIWEVRSGAAHHTHSKVLCWAALNRLLLLEEGGHLKLDRARFSAEAETIRQEIESRGYNSEIASYTRVFGSHDVDAALLALPHFGYLEADDPRMRSTAARIKQELAVGPLLHRYRSDTDDGLPGEEGAFGACAFWWVEWEARAGDLDAAEDHFVTLLQFANDVGLFAEEIDPRTGMHLGNFPQAFTHIGLINAAITLERARKAAEPVRTLAPAAGHPS